MPGYILDAAFVLTGALLMRQLVLLWRAVRRPVPRFFISAAMGLCLLLTGNTLGSLFGVGLGVNVVTLPVSTVLGVPGVALLWTLRYLV